MLKLEVLAADGRRAEYELGEIPILIGRSWKCSVALKDSRASRRHATIEWRDGSPTLIDLNSSNGTFVNGRRIQEHRLRAGDEVSIGSSVIAVLQIGGAEPIPADVGDNAARHGGPLDALAPPRASVAGESGAGDSSAPRENLESRLRQRRLLVSLGPVAVVAAAAALVAAWLVFWNQPPEGGRPRIAARAVRLRQAEEELRALRAEVIVAGRILPAILAHAGRLEHKYRDLEFPDGTRPFANFHVALRSRHRLETGNDLFDLARQKNELLAARRYGEALRFVTLATEALLRNAPLAEEDARKVLATTREEVEFAYNRLASKARYLREMDLSEECLGLYEKGFEVFVGTEYSARLQTELESFKKELLAAKAKVRAELAAQREALRRERQQRSRPEKEPDSVADILAGALAKVIAGGPLSKNSYSFSDFEGRPLGFRAGGNLRVATSEGERLVALEEIPPPTLVRMAQDGLRGVQLLNAARFAYEADLAEQGDRLLLRYVRQEGGSFRQADNAAALVIAQARGLAEVPDGGFTYTNGHGWEDAIQRRERLAIDEAGKIHRKLASASSEKALGQNFEKLRALLSEGDLSGKTRGTIRNGTIAALSSLRERLVERLVRRVNRSSFARLYKAREELNRRRGEALKLIYDTRVYLPENHPDYPKGDEVNGQAAVDEAVEAARELWESAGQFAVAIDPQTARLSEMLRLIDEAFYPELRHEPQVEEEDSLEQIRNNLDKVVDLRRFSLNRAEVALYEYNRKVEAYNRNLAEADVSEQVKAHVAVVNEYREMLGRRRCFIDVRICRATAKHSKACDQAGRIWHNGPDGSPGSRARAEGFGASVAENVAIGYANPKDIWERGWYRASDHHRNALGANWTCIGYGYVGRVGTQNFASIGAPFR